MITKDEAERIAGDFLTREFPTTDEVKLVIDDSATVEKPYGWVFIPTTARYLQTGDFDDQFIGAGPLLVQREDGKLVEFSSMYSTAMVVAEYEAGLE
jgi:hypothetical protein